MSGEGEISTGMEEQNLAAEIVYAESIQTRSYDLCHQVSLLS